MTKTADIMAAATKGPWIVGDPYCIAGVLVEKFGDGCCAYCAYSGEPIWTGHRDINGKRMMAHVHLGDDLSEGHGISGPLNDGYPVAVAGNYDYEAGGIIEPADARAIVTAVNLFPLYEAVREAALAAVDSAGQRTYSNDRVTVSGAALDALRAALDALQAAEDAL